MSEVEFRAQFLRMMENKENPFHPLVWINGDPDIGPGTYIGGFSEIYAKGAKVTIGANCDIASFVAINVADSHMLTLELSDTTTSRNIEIGERVFIGSHSAIFGGSRIGHHSVIGAGTIVRGLDVPPFSLVVGNPAIVKPGYYLAAWRERHQT